MLAGCVGGDRAAGHFRIPPDLNLNFFAGASVREVGGLELNNALLTFGTWGIKT